MWGSQLYISSLLRRIKGKNVELYKKYVQIEAKMQQNKAYGKIKSEPERAQISVMCDVIGEDITRIPINLNFPWTTVMCDATQYASDKSRENHS